MASIYLHYSRTGICSDAIECGNGFKIDDGPCLSMRLLIIIETLPANAAKASLLQDVALLERIVTQLLRLTQADNYQLDKDARADLRQVALEVAGMLAPGAIRAGKSVSVTGATGPVTVRGNPDYLQIAVRNLVENGLAHSPPGGTVEIHVGDDGPYPCAMLARELNCKTARICLNGSGAPITAAPLRARGLDYPSLRGSLIYMAAASKCLMRRAAVRNSSCIYCLRECGRDDSRFRAHPPASLRAKRGNPESHGMAFVCDSGLPRFARKDDKG
jgi:hypothetical protein